jgi:hypothetical protein
MPSSQGNASKNLMSPSEGQHGAAYVRANVSVVPDMLSDSTNL